MQSILLIIQIISCLALGFVIGPFLKQTTKQLILKSLGYFSYLLLAGIAFEFTLAIDQIEQFTSLLFPAVLIASSTTIFSFLCSYFIFTVLDPNTIQGRVSFELFFKALKNIFKASLALLLGFFIGKIALQMDVAQGFSSWYLLLLFIFMIGIELSITTFSRAWLSWKILVVPIAAIIGTCIASALNYLVLSPQYKWNEILALGQGYGWYSMSSILIAQLDSTQLATIALLTDLFREIIAILLMYLLGWRYPRSVISSAGATSMDATLPMVKQSCGTAYVPHAMVSGLVLSLLAPLLITFSLTILP